MRSRQPSRLQGFSDAVFGFALTLLVVSLEVPKTFEELTAVVRGFVPFAITFAYVAWIWYEHYAFFGRFDPDDRVTIALNCTLLFVVLYYVYPLKFLFTLVVNSMMGLPAFAQSHARPGDSARLMIIYGLGYFIAFVTLALMYFNVLRRRAAMRLTVLETFEAKAGVQYHLGNAAVGVVSMPIVAIGGEPWAAWSGMSYALIGVVQGRPRRGPRPRRHKLKAEENLVV